MNEYLAKLDKLVDTVEDIGRLPEQPLVSVWMITYNHERYIRQALDGILMQEVDFSYEIVIGEDKSTDRTREIVCEYQRKHPAKIRLRLSRENLYSQGLKPGAAVLYACRGKYIAMCEGDDYWTDPQKLQKQVTWMEDHLEASFCFHSCRLEDVSSAGDESNHDGRCRSIGATEQNYFEDSRALVMWCIVPTVSAVLRKSMLPDLGGAWRALPVGDWPLFFYLGMQGPFGRLPEMMAVYRRHGGGVWSSRSLQQQKNVILDTYRFIRGLGMARFPDEFRQADVKQLRDYLDDLFWKSKEKQGLNRLLAQGIDRLQSPFFSARRLSRLALEALYYKTRWAGRREHARAVLAELVIRHPTVLLNRHWLRCVLRR